MSLFSIIDTIEKGYVDKETLRALNEELPNGLPTKYSPDIYEYTTESFNRELVGYIKFQIKDSTRLTDDEVKVLTESKELAHELSEAMTELSFRIPSRTKIVEIDDHKVNVSSIKEVLSSELDTEHALLYQLDKDSTVEDFIKWSNKNPYGRIYNSIYKDGEVVKEKVSAEAHKFVELLANKEEAQTTLSYIRNLTEELPVNLLEQKLIG